MFITNNRIFVNPDHAAVFEDNFRNRARLVDSMPGFIRNLLLRPVNPGDPYIVQTMWESRAHFQAWVGSEEFKQGHARSGTLPKDAFSAQSKLEVYDLVLDSENPDFEPQPSAGPLVFHS
jgi:heme oxygenase (mycobilin-producing)